MQRTLIIFSIILLYTRLNAQTTMPLDSLYLYFQRVNEICNRDNGKLWGKSLFGPILVINKSSKVIVANEPDLEGQLKRFGNVYVGKYPNNEIVASGATTFAGKSWAVISYPFSSEDTFDIYSTYIHESFHRIQSVLGFNCKSYDNNHMDKMTARIYLNLEWQALLKAINTSKEKRKQAIKDALLFRKYRRQLFPGADSMESRFELHEGLADYTSFKLCCNSKSELKERILQRKSRFLNNGGSYIRSFGYYSGLLYAYLLDETGASWQKSLKCEDDLGNLLQQLLKIDISCDTAHWFNRAKGCYPYEEIYNKEVKINNEKEKILVEYRIRFSQNPVVIFDLIKPAYGIYRSPRPLDKLGTVYPMIDISDKWGLLKVTDHGCLIGINKAMITADSISLKNEIIFGAGWNLKLNNNWTIIKHDNNYFIEEINNAH